MDWNKAPEGNKFVSDSLQKNVHNSLWLVPLYIIFSEDFKRKEQIYDLMQ